MKQKCPYVILFLMVFLLKPAGILFGQTDSMSSIILFSCNVMLDDQILTLDEFSIEVNINGSVYSTAETISGIEGLAEIAFPDTFNIGIDAYQSMLNFRLFTNGCYTNKITYKVDTLGYRWDSIIVTSFNARSYSVEYPSAVCQNSAEIFPGSNIDLSLITYESTSGLSISDSGRIDPAQSLPGIYTIQMQTEYCLKTDTQQIAIIEQPDFSFIEEKECEFSRIRIQVNSDDSPSIRWSDNTTDNEIEVTNSSVVWATITNNYGCSTTDSMNVTVSKLEFLSPVIEKQESDCWVDGKVKIEAATIRNNVGDYSYRLINTVNGAVVLHLDNVPEGEYKLQVVDSRDCIADAPEKLTIKQKCLENYPVFTPNSDGIEDQYFIPYQGNVKIYNAESKFVKELESPAYWDGTDEAGNVLPMGNYVMITDQGRPVNITIVR